MGLVLGCRLSVNASLEGLRAKIRLSVGIKC